MGQSWNKAHDASKNSYWKNLPSTDTPIVKDELNRNETSVDTIDDRVITLDTTKAEQSDFLGAFLSVTFDSSTGTFTFTKANGTTVVINTDIEKIAVNFDYDDDPTSAHYQNLVLTLSDGTVKYVDLSALITQYEFSDTSTIAFTVSAGGGITANVVNGSITADKLQPNYLADVTTQANNASASATSAGNYKLDAEAWANGTRNGADVPSTDPAYHNNSKYWKDQTQAIASGSISGLSDVDIDTPTLANGQVLTYVSADQMWENKVPEVTRLKSLDMVGKTTTFNADGSISVVADDYKEAVEFNANGSITEKLRYNGKNLCISATATDSLSQYYTACFAEIDNFTPSTTYTFSFVGTNGNKIYPNENVFTSSAGFTIASGRTTVTLTTKSDLPSNQYDQSLGGWKLFKNVFAQSNANVFNDFQVEVGSTATTYEPYYNYTKTTHFMGSDIIEDLHDYQGCVDLGTLTWTYSSSTFRGNLQGAKTPSANNVPAKIYCSKYGTYSRNEIVNGTKGVSLNRDDGYVWIYDSAYTDATTFKNAMSGVYLTYELSTQ